MYITFLILITPVVANDVHTFCVCGIIFVVGMIPKTIALTLT